MTNGNKAIAGDWVIYIHIPIPNQDPFLSQTLCSRLRSVPLNRLYLFYLSLAGIFDLGTYLEVPDFTLRGLLPWVFAKRHLKEFRLPTSAPPRAAPPPT